MSFFGLFLVKKQPKLIKNKENWQNPNRLIKNSEIWYVNASQQKKIRKTILQFGHFYAFFGKKQPKLTQNEENWQNPNRLIKLSKTWYVNASQQKKS